jgi:hypothetical protein
MLCACAFQLLTFTDKVTDSPVARPSLQSQHLGFHLSKIKVRSDMRFQKRDKHDDMVWACLSSFCSHVPATKSSPLKVSVRHSFLSPHLFKKNHWNSHEDQNTKPEYKCSVPVFSLPAYNDTCSSRTRSRHQHQPSGVHAFKTYIGMSYGWKYEDTLIHDYAVRLCLFLACG